MAFRSMPEHFLGQLLPLSRGILKQLVQLRLNLIAKATQQQKHVLKLLELVLYCTDGHISEYHCGFRF